LIYTPNSPKMEYMDYIARKVEEKVRSILERGRSVLLLGPRQTGKTTLLDRIRCDLTVSLVRPDVRIRYEKEPGLLAAEVEAIARPKGTDRIVCLDEVQKVPRILDVVQDLIDRKAARFLLTGSSARKLRRGSDVNLLPGRIVPVRLDPLMLNEISPGNVDGRVLPRLLLEGSLPGIWTQEDEALREEELMAYATVYLEEEVRAEAIVRNLGAFARFLELAAIDSGRIANFRNLSREIGIAHTTVAAYYEVLEDCLVAERIDPIAKSRSRMKLTRSPKYLLFDLGLRRVCAREGTRLSAETMGHLLEQWAALELIRIIRASGSRWRVRFWRDPDGPEVDWVLEGEDRLIPIEVKWTENPASRDARHLLVFLDEYRSAKRGYIVCRAPRRASIAPNVTAIPWHEIGTILEE
jgi:uncharacterized protein